MDMLEGGQPGAAAGSGRTEGHRTTGDELIMLVLGQIGWRRTFAWRREARLATLAAVWIPLPYVLAHAGTLGGPRLPLDGVILCFVAFALACVSPVLASRLANPEA